MSRRQARIIKQLRADLEVDRKLLRAYQLLYGKNPQEQPPTVTISGSTADTITPLYRICAICSRLENPLTPHQHTFVETPNGPLTFTG